MDLYELMMKRRSVRAFEAREIPETIIEKLLDVANHAPSGGNIQPLSILLVRSPEARLKLSELAGGQPWVKNAPLSMIFCLDFYRIKKWAERCQTDFRGEQALNHFLIAYADLMAAAQNVVILAESLGLGSVYIGAIQHEIDETRRYFDLPQYVLPMMVLCIGYPKSIPRTIPKLNKKVIVHQERYRLLEDEEIQRAFDEKYGRIDEDVEKYLERAFIEALEAEKQEEEKFLERVKKEMKRLDIQNNAQFLFKVRYPSKVMVRMNQRIKQSIKNAGFEIF
ncbi:MAG: nitroreductase family protein [Desulfobacterota bacterium]|nr:nitroreductase family protein [Thermodesulfobacteriota bacterium]